MKTSIIAAKWWADLLLQKPNHNNGDANISAFANMIASSLQPLSSTQIKIFCDALEKAIEQRLEIESSFSFGTDYSPDRFLMFPINLAEIDRESSRFPIKTVMWVEHDTVRVACGYRAPIETLWEANN